MTTTEELRTIESVLITRRNDLQARLEADRQARQEFRDRVTKVAHDLGWEHGIGSSLDEMMDALGLPRRPVMAEVYFTVAFTQDVHDHSYTMRLDDEGLTPAMNYTGVSGRVPAVLSWGVDIGMSVTVPDGTEGCVCGAYTDDTLIALAREKTAGYFRPNATVTGIAGRSCLRDGCVNAEPRRAQYTAERDRRRALNAGV